MATINRDFAFETFHNDVTVKKLYGSSDLIVVVDLGYDTRTITLPIARGAQSLKVALDEALQIYVSETVGKTTKGAE